MSKKLYIGNLPYSVDDAQLESMAVAFGEVVSAQVIQDKFNGRSKGFGFVEMANDEEAQKAIDDLNNKEIDGRKIIVNEARPMEKRDGDRKPFRNGGGRGGDRGGRGGDRGGRGGSGGGRGDYNRW
ncbi:MAG: RNP-1 like protein RNA-binding protein [uncultured bacterium]|nr:MAG: RNP-1 like protein RNA-binding protein [uncultured bacterium]